MCVTQILGLLSINIIRTSCNKPAVLRITIYEIYKRWNITFTYTIKMDKQINHTKKPKLHSNFKPHSFERRTYNQNNIAAFALVFLS